jgi:hypothetical protein
LAAKDQIAESSVLDSRGLLEEVRAVMEQAKASLAS